MTGFTQNEFNRWIQFKDAQRIEQVSKIVRWQR
jgi:hypothetical protein